MAAAPGASLLASALPAQLAQAGPNGDLLSNQRQNSFRAWRQPLKPAPAEFPFFRAASAPVNGFLRSHSNLPLPAHGMLITAWFAVNYAVNGVKSREK
jgi:hypothetical protein